MCSGPFLWARNYAFGGLSSVGESFTVPARQSPTLLAAYSTINCCEAVPQRTR